MPGIGRREERGVRKEAERRPHLSLSVQYACDAEGMPTRPQFRRWVKAALSASADMALRIVDEAEGRALNRDFRGKDYATNVLTFAYGEEAGTLSGDIVICAPVVEREAHEQGKTVLEHYAHLTIHGVLHLQGYDHEHEREAREMEGIEVEIMRKLGFNDPYASEQS
jgi:probable rRNA maturation factor